MDDKTPAPTGIEALLAELEALREYATRTQWGYDLYFAVRYWLGGPAGKYIKALFNAAPELTAHLRSQSRALAEREETIGRLREALELIERHGAYGGCSQSVKRVVEQALASAPKGEGDG